MQVATIQDVDNLTVEVTIPASSVGRLKAGMQCNITSDATDDTVTGTLTRIDPVANDSGSFGATVTVNSQDSGLLIGISAKVEIIVSEKDNVFTVPRDAVGTNDDGSTYVLRKTGGEGVDMTFEQVAVTEGDTNDYYVEITGDDLNEGDVIRATADLTQGMETSTSQRRDADDGERRSLRRRRQQYAGGHRRHGRRRRPRRRPRRPGRSVMPENTQQFAQNIAQSLIGEEAAHPAQPLIQMQGIRKSYYIGQPNELEILHGIDLTVYPGEFVAIVGESGSGKSTLMNIIGVLDKPTAGEYVLDGVNIHDADDNDLAAIRNRKIGFVFQTYNLIGRQSALKNVELPMLYAGVPAGERTRRAKEWLERVGMGERMRHQPNELSGGQKQRVAIARAMVNEPALILADEPTGALDSQTSRVVMDLFHELHEKYHKTIVLITHNP